MPRVRFEALDSLRGIAALGVAWGHFYGPPIAGGTRQFAFYLLVDLFFVLSGFVLAHRYLDEMLDRRVTLKEFAVHRFARLWSQLDPPDARVHRVLNALHKVELDQ